MQERANADDRHDPLFVSQTELCVDAVEVPRSLVSVQGVRIHVPLTGAIVLSLGVVCIRESQDCEVGGRLKPFKRTTLKGE